MLFDNILLFIITNTAVSISNSHTQLYFLSMTVEALNCYSYTQALLTYRIRKRQTGKE